MAPRLEVWCENVPLLLSFWTAPSASHWSCSTLQQNKPGHPRSRTTLAVCTTPGTQFSGLHLIRKKTQTCNCLQVSSPEPFGDWKGGIHVFCFICFGSTSTDKNITGISICYRSRCCFFSLLGNVTTGPRLSSITGKPVLNGELRFQSRADRQCYMTVIKYVELPMCRRQFTYCY